MGPLPEQSPDGLNRESRCSRNAVIGIAAAPKLMTSNAKLLGRPWGVKSGERREVERAGDGGSGHVSDSVPSLTRDNRTLLAHICARARV